VLGALVGCTSADDEFDGRHDGDGTPRAEASPEPFVTGECLDGAAALVVDAEHPEVTFDEACETVSVIGTDGTVTLGAVGHLVVEGRGLTITAETVTAVDFAGDDNVLSHGGAAPTVTENGTTGNTVGPS